MSKLTKIKDRIRDDVKNFGIVKTVIGNTFKIINSFMYFRILKCMTIGVVDPKYLKLDEKYTCTFLDAEMLSKFKKYKEYDLSDKFLDHALSKGDECLAILDGDTLASYGWYASTATNIADELRLHFSRDYVYMYQGYTHKNYRGQRLHAIGMSRALNEYLNRGYKGLFSWVELHNYASLKSVYRMGYQDIGNVYVIGAFGKYLVYSDEACKASGVWLEPLDSKSAEPLQVAAKKEQV